MLPLVAFAIKHIAPLPFRIQLEDVSPLNPDPYLSKIHFALSKYALQDIQASTKLTDSGHILLMCHIQPGFDATPLQLLSRSSVLTFPGKLVVRDAMDVCRLDKPGFQCFVTNDMSSICRAARIRGTSIWLLISDHLECNPCKCVVNRAEYNDIQVGFMSMLVEADSRAQVKEVADDV